MKVSGEAASADTTEVAGRISGMVERTLMKDNTLILT